MTNRATVDRGAGSAVVLIPGIQGHWEWMASTVAALSRRHRVLTFSLDVVSGSSLFDAWTTHIDAMLERAGQPRAAIVGVSFGGLVAAYYAARRPERVTHLVLVSSPSPHMPLDARSSKYLRRPRWALPLFALRATTRLGPEIAATFATWPARAGFTVRHLARVLRWPLSPPKMAAWVREWMTTNVAEGFERIAAPTLVITGETHLDRVVPVASTLEYLRLIPGARHVVLKNTGHIGVLSQADAFSRLVSEFIAAGPDAAAAPPAATVAAR